MSNKKTVMTTAAGCPVADNQNSITAGPRGPILMQDVHLFEKLVRNHIGWMLALARRILGDHALAEDAVQDAFINAFHALDSFEGRSSLKTWLHRITVNACLMKMRQSKQRAEQAIDEYLPEFDQNN